MALGRHGHGLAMRAAREAREATTGLRAPSEGPRRPGRAHGEDRWIAGEADTIVRVLRERGPVDAGTLKELVEARYWGPGRFRSALQLAKRQGRVRAVGRRELEATPEEDVSPRRAR